MDCHWFNISHCRSCELIDKSYASTLLLKEEKLIALFSGIDLNLQKTIGVNIATGSRNKAKLAVFGNEQTIEFGFYNSSMKFHILEECPMHMPELNTLLTVLKSKLLKYKIVPYSLKEKKGELKYVILSQSESNKDVLLRFVVRSKESLDRLQKLAQELITDNLSVKVVTVNFQPEHKAIMEGVEEIVLTDKKYIIHQFGSIQLTLGPRSFFQVTPEIAGQLYKSVGEAVRKHNIKTFLDLYCGVGAFSYFAAQSCPDVLGVEISEEAINCANASKELNTIKDKIEFKSLDVDKFLKTEQKSFEAILVNPPRRGLSPDIMANILKQMPKILIYSSCNAETLLRDFSSFSKNYEILDSRIFDMFPFTEHFETLMLFSRKET